MWLASDDVTTVAELLVGRYELRECVGSGGMGVVHRAHDHLLDRDVAVKLPNLDVGTNSNERFRREARAAARLNHPNIVSVYDWEEHDGQTFIVMEYVDGQSLRASSAAAGRSPCARRRGSVSRWQPRSRHAHAKGVVHRDIKPGNVLLASSGTSTEPIVKVTDFGIARASDSDTITDPGTVIGTVGYVAPEQLRGARVDGRTDIYALGVLLATLTGGAPGALEPVVKRDTQPEPADRYQRVAELRDVLAGIANGDTLTAIPVVAPPPRRAIEPGRPAGSRTSDARDRAHRSAGASGRFVTSSPMLVPLLLLAAAVPAYFAVAAPPTAPVPEVVNRDIFSAATIVRDAKFTLVQRFVDSPVAGGTVLDQRPRSGEEADEGSDIVLTVSRVEATVPRVAGYMVDEAKARLAARRVLERRGHRRRPRRRATRRRAALHARGRAARRQDRRCSPS